MSIGNTRYFLNSRLFILVALALLFLLPIDALAEKTKLVYWHTWTQQWEEMVNHVVKQFEERYPSIEVEPIIISGNFFEKLITSIAAGVAPDVATVYSCANIPPLAAKGLITPLPESDRAQVEQWVYKPFLEMGEWQGQIYGLSYWQQSSALAWRVSSLNEVGLDSVNGPTSLAMLDEYARKLTGYSPEGHITRMGFLPQSIEHWIGAFGGYLYEPTSRRITADLPENIAAFEWMTSYWKYFGIDNIGRWQSIIATERAGVNDPFIRGDVTIELIGGAWKIADFQIFGLPEDEWDLGASPVAPYLTGSITYTYGDFSVVPITSKHKEEAWEFVKFTAGASGNVESYIPVLFWGGRPINLPVSAAVYHTKTMIEIVKQFPKFAKLINIAFSENTRIISPPKTPVWFEYISKLYEALDAMRKGDVAEATALANVARVVQALEDQYWR
jgi:multiple sugar transport system substrate-binding protein